MLDVSLSEAEKALKYVFRTMSELNASEIHLLLPLEAGVEGSSACRVKGILVDIDPEIETMLGRHGSEVLQLIYTMAISQDSAFTRERVMSGRITNLSHLPEGMDSIDVFMIPAPNEGTHVFLRPRPLPAAQGHIDASWNSAAVSVSELVMRPASGLTVFLSPDSDVATAMMHHAASLVATNGIRRIMVFDTMPWSGKTNLGISDLPSSAVAESALVASSAGIDIIVLGELHHIDNAKTTIERLLVSGTHVWIRLRASTTLSHIQIKRLLGLSSSPSVVVKCARLLMNDDNSVKLSDSFSAKWLMSNKVPVIKGSMQLSPHSDFPNTLFIAACSESSSEENDKDDSSYALSISEMGATLVDRGIVCGFDTSRKLS